MMDTTNGTTNTNGKGPELSLYDMHRKPHPVITDTSADIIVSPRSLSSELMCPICLDMLKNTMTTKECLHRFCLECITTALRSGNKECPTCRKKLVSKRSLRADPNFDALIQKIYPDRAEYDAIQERVFARMNRHSNPEALQKSIEEGIKHQAQLRRSRKINPADFECQSKKRKRIAKDSNNSSDRESSVELSMSDVSGTGTTGSHLQEIVDHLSKYLAMRVQLDSEETKSENEENRPSASQPEEKNDENSVDNRLDESSNEMREPVVDKGERKGKARP